MSKGNKRYLYWPIRIKVGGYWNWFKRHGWEVGADGVGLPVYGWTLHLGKLKICFGNEKFKKKPRKLKKAL